MAERADGAGGLPDRHIRRRRPEPLEAACSLVVPQSQLETEGDRLGMDPVGAAHLHGVLELEGPGLQYRPESLDTLFDQGGSLLDLEGLRSIYYIVRS